MKIRIFTIAVFAILYFPLSLSGQYCIPVVTGAGAGITNVTLNTLTNPTAAGIGYVDYSGSTVVPDIIRSNTEQLQITTGVFQFFEVWIDWNQNTVWDFGEQMPFAAGTGTTININVPVGALLGNTRMRVASRTGFVGGGPCTIAQADGDIEDYTVNIIELPMQVDSITSNQIAYGCFVNDVVDKMVVQSQVDVSFTVSPQTLTSVEFNTGASTSALTDIANARCYQTTTPNFSKNNPFGALIPSPNGAMVFNGVYALSPGTHYFWLTYDIPIGAGVGNLVEAELTQITVDAVPYAPTALSTSFSQIIDARSNYRRKEANIWYTDKKVGIDFNCMTPVVIGNQGATFATSLTEGSGSICRANGDLLYYADAANVLNRVHERMPNGFGIKSLSSKTVGLFIPRPGSATNTFMISPGQGTGGPDSIYYSEIDLSLDGGFGDVIPGIKNVLLAPDVFAEVATAVDHCNRIDVWVVYPKNLTGEIYANLITAAGVNPVPVISSGAGFPVYTDAGRGVIKFSPDGKWLFISPQSGGQPFLLSFDKSTGVFSNPIALNTNDKNAGSFSPDNSKLYLGQTGSNRLYQYDLCSANIAASRTLIGTVPGNSLWLIQNAPDGKIYMDPGSNASAYSVINNPNNLGAACNFVANGFSLAPFTHNGTLNFISAFNESIFNQSILDSTVTGNTLSSVVICPGETITFTDTSGLIKGCIPTPPTPRTYLWNFGDPTSGVLNTSSLQNPTHIYNTPGIFTVEFIITEECQTDTVVKTITVNPLATGTASAAICIGDSILLGGSFQTVAGNYNDTIFGGSSLGCDSIVTTTLTINPLATGTDVAAICPGDSILLGGSFQMVAGNYNDTIFGGSGLGCDSIVTTTLTINPLATGTDAASICQGDSILLGGSFQTIAGNYNDTIFGGSGLGCDSIVTTTLTINPLAAGTDVAAICQGDSILLGGSFQTIAGNYNDTIFGGSGLGCDSIVTTTLTINPLATGADVAAICQGDSILLGGSFQTIAGNYNDTIFGGSGLGCDSIVTTTLTINPLATGVDVAAICQGDSILLGGSFQTIAGNYNDTIIGGSGLGCDSIVTTTLTINPLATSTATAAICPGDSILLGGSFQTIAGNYNDTIFGGSGSGCDSIVTTTLSINPLATSTEVASRCDGDSILLGGSYQYASGVFVDTLFGASFLGCDSIITTTLTFFPTDNASFTYPDTAYCESATNPLPTGIVTPGGAFTIDNGGVINATTGEVDLQNSGLGTFIITYTTTGGCFGATTFTLTINPSDDAAFSFANSTYCSNEINPTPTVSGTLGGVFTINNGGVINASTGEVDLATSGTGSFVITYTTTGICFDSETTSITIENCSPPIADFTINDSIICEGDCVDLVNTSQFATALLWTIPGGTPDSSTSMTPTICFPNGGNFVVTLTVMNQFGTSTKTMTVKVNANPIIDAGSDVTIPLGATTQLFVTGANSYSWSPSIYLNCSMCEDPVAAPPATTPFIVIAVDDNGCEGRDTVIVIIDGEIDIFIPNVFSPNGDGENDMFRVFGSSFPEKYSMKIYNRWGGLVFESEDENTVWDGKDKKGEIFPQAVFVYTFIGTTVSGQYIERNGNVMLSR